MSKRLQVLFGEEELAEIRAAARRKRVTVAEWVRSALRSAREQESRPDPRSRLEATHKAYQYSFPVGDIDEMLAEIERGYDSLP
ncbi:MAG: antitoxin [Candidatus Xenobia bacterium]